MFDRLAIHDRRHLVAVARQLESADPRNSDLIVAGLLHDIGKADDRDHVTFIDRILRVFLGRVSPGLLDRLACPDGIGIRRRLYLTLHHARLGAALAEQRGCSERTVWLIKNHEVSDPTDPDLRRLVEIDGATP
ncbi:MAG: HDIG domain-containing protein [Thermomicrobiales bacterium]|nr:HDIG domain-containing protein [Thermomicrobiales bacterium]